MFRSAAVMPGAMTVRIVMAMSAPNDPMVMPHQRPAFGLPHHPPIADGAAPVERLHQCRGGPRTNGSDDGQRSRLDRDDLRPDRRRGRGSSRTLRHTRAGGQHAKRECEAYGDGMLSAHPTEPSHRFIRIGHSRRPAREGTDLTTDPSPTDKRTCGSAVAR